MRPILKLLAIAVCSALSACSVPAQDIELNAALEGPPPDHPHYSAGPVEPPLAPLPPSAGIESSPLPDLSAPAKSSAWDAPKPQAPARSDGDGWTAVPPQASSPSATPAAASPGDASAGIKP